MIETVMVLLVFLIILILSFLFFLRIMGSQSGRTKDLQGDLSTIQIAQQASFLPEIQCTIKQVVKDNCIDLYKAISFREMIYEETNEAEKLRYEYYFDLFGRSNVTIEEIYPNKRNITIYDRDNDIEGGYRSNKVFVPVSLYNATNKEYSFGLLTITTYT